MEDLSLEYVDKLDRDWTDAFILREGWNERRLNDPVHIIDAFAKHIPGTAMLDVGCGWGRYVWRFAERGLRYEGIDHSTEAIRYARQSNPQQSFRVGTMRAMPYADDQFDGIWNCCALSGFPKKYLGPVLAEHHRVVRPGGIFMFILPYPPYGFGDEELVHDDANMPILYQSYYDLDEFCSFLKNAHIRPIDAAYELEQGSQYVLAQKEA